MRGLHNLFKSAQGVQSTENWFATLTRFKQQIAHSHYINNGKELKLGVLNKHIKPQDS